LLTNKSKKILPATATAR